MMVIEVDFRQAVM